MMHLSEKEKIRLRNNYGDWAIITGASSGIGLELATQLASAGFNLILHGRNVEKLEQLCDHLISGNHIAIKIVVADLSQPNEVDKIIQIAENLPIGLLILAAGFGSSGLFTDQLLSNEMNQLAVNAGAVLSLTHYFSRYFKQQKRGGIIIMSSMVAFQGTPYAANYAATKAYVQSLAEAVHVELKPYGVHVLAAAPGPVTSGFGARANMKMLKTLQPSQVGVPILKALGKNTTVLPGWLTKFLVYALRTVPRWGKIKIMAKVMGGMTAHQRS